MFAHLAALLILNVAQHDAVEEGGGIEQAGRYCGKGIEPAAGLVYGLADKVGGVAALKLILVFKGIVPLGEGHGAGIEPAVYDHRLAAHGAAALALPGERIHIGLMQLDVFVAAGKLGELLTAADDVYLAALVAYPYGQGGAPVALPGDAPVYYVLQEVAHAAFLDGFGDPVDTAVVVYQPVLYLGHGYEPGGAGIVDKRRVAAPAEGVAVLKPGGGKEKAALVQILEHHGIGLLYEYAVPGGAAAHFALGIHHLNKGQVVFLAYPVIVLAEGGSVMDYAGTVGGGDIVVHHHIKGVLAAGGFTGAFKKGLVVLVFKLPADDLFYYLCLVALQHRPYKILGHDEGLLAVHPHICVGHVGIDAEGNVAGQRPWRGGPGQEVGVLLIGHPEADGGGGLLDLLIALSYLVGGEGGAAAGAVGDYLVALVEKALFVYGLQRPPLRLYIVVVIGDVWVIHIRPEAHAVGHYLPLALVLPYGFLALLDEGDNAVLLYLLFSVEAQLFFHLQLNGKAVGIPPGLTQHVVTPHGLVAGDYILHGTGQYMAYVGLAVGGRRAVKEGVGGGALPKLDALFEYLVILPEFQRLLLAFHEIQRGRNFLVHLLLLSVL